mmetsp:Transcript_122373/g.280399  ORF Transcript_122373/g.280399 Transcript_122373/m.280399 type:complete len:80 (-) Transcript_122373:231-470(-)
MGLGRRRSTSGEPQGKTAKLEERVTPDAAPGQVVRDLNPIAPCGACNEWLKKIAEGNPGFTVVTFSSIEIREIFMKRVV